MKQVASQRLPDKSTCQRWSEKNGICTEGNTKPYYIVANLTAHSIFNAIVCFANGVLNTKRYQ